MRQLFLICLLVLLPMALAAEEKDPTPELVYAAFEHTVLDVGGEQIVKLDATNFYGGISSAHAIIRAPDGTEQTIMLRLEKGNENYGTWRGYFTETQDGQHDLIKVILGDGYELPHEFAVNSTSFWVTSATAHVYYDVVYTALDKFTAEIGEEFTLTMDARDTLGIDNITATFEWNGGKMTVPLDHIKGDAFYGTYQAIITPKVGGTLYNLTAITITNPRGARTTPITERRIYVLQEEVIPPPPPEEAPFVPSNEQEFEAQLKNPMLPTKLAFTLMAFLLVFLLTSHKIIKSVMGW